MQSRASVSIFSQVFDRKILTIFWEMLERVSSKCPNYYFTNSSLSEVGM
jgi:hypothetical protein